MTVSAWWQAASMARPTLRATGRDRAAMRVGKGASPGVGAARAPADCEAIACAPRRRCAARTGARHGFEQRPRIGMRRSVEQVLRRPLLDDPAEIHHRDLVAEMIRPPRGRG